MALSRTDLKATRDFDEVAAIYDSFKDPAARAAIRHVVKAVIDWRGQIVTMADRAYLTEQMPMAVIWGRDDRVIPVRHASNAAALAPNARIEVIPHAGHFPHKDHPQRFAKIVHEFIRSTQPATYSRAPVPRPAQDRALRAGESGRLGRGTRPPDARLASATCWRSRATGPLATWYVDDGGPLALWRELADDVTGGPVDGGPLLPRGASRRARRAAHGVPPATPGLGDASLLLKRVVDLVTKGGNRP